MWQCHLLGLEGGGETQLHQKSIPADRHAHTVTITVTTFKIKPTSSRYRCRQSSSKTLARASWDPARGGEGGDAGVAVGGLVVAFRGGSCHRSSDRTAASHPLPCPNSKA